MKSPLRTLPTPAFGCSVAAAALWAASAAAQTPLPAQTPYKVIAPDGKVTYTDRPAASDTRVSAVGRGGAVVPSETPLPLELRQVVARYPVTLYVSEDCDPCNSARQLLRQRGIPYAEKQVVTPADSLALEQLSGGSEAPTLAVGAQMLRGLSTDVWHSYLDAAGYPRDSRLPPNYQYAAPTPLVARAAPPAAVRPASPQDAPPTLPNLPDAAGIRF